MLERRRLFPYMTVSENLLLGAYLPALRSARAHSLERVESLFPILAERRRQLAHSLSGGEQQQVAIARALMIDPELLLMDEPSEGLAPVMVRHLEDIVVRLKADGLAILLVEQNLFSALAVADRVYVMESGRIVFESAAAAVTANPGAITSFLGVHA